MPGNEPAQRDIWSNYSSKCLLQELSKTSYLGRRFSPTANKSLMSGLMIVHFFSLTQCMWVSCSHPSKAAAQGWPWKCSLTQTGEVWILALTSGSESGCGPGSKVARWAPGQHRPPNLAVHSWNLWESVEGWKKVCLSSSCLPLLT